MHWCSTGNHFYILCWCIMLTFFDDAWMQPWCFTQQCCTHASGMAIKHYTCIINVSRQAERILPAGIVLILATRGRHQKMALNGRKIKSLFGSWYKMALFLSPDNKTELSAFSDVIHYYSVIQARDTDLLVLLLTDYERICCTILWVQVGIIKTQKYIPLHKFTTTCLVGPVLHLLHFIHYLAQTQLHSLCNIQSRKQLVCSSSIMFSLMVVEKAKYLWLRTCREVWLSHLYIVPYARSEDNIRVIQFGHCKRTELQPKMHWIYISCMCTTRVLFGPHPRTWHSLSYKQGMKVGTQCAGTFVNYKGLLSSCLPVYG